MSELVFAKQFLTALDSRPIKLSSDHIADPRSYPASNAYTLPRLPPGHPSKPLRKSPTNPAATSHSITLKPLKPSQPTITLPSQPPSTSIYDLKAAYAAQTSTDIAKIKVLYKKKPVADSKILSELAGDNVGAALEFGVMILGGGVGGTPVGTPPVEIPQPLMGEKEVGAVAQGPSGAEELRTEEFWRDLKGFLVQRLRDEGEGERWAKAFRGVWEKEG
ncbi:uncharacterized protein BDZ99DRAFT_570508 [Mytilinidion resinicola]|uniref:Ubiquitin-like domain-containing protein n=1 Tax=Mytilinidion resinicola TaxID=574789 RepID=A0A6A6YQU9_9PEZI|nr:uncharacterized protein BDZ99DRAFT_570508 [Mytilinidion resinicola]KAF2811286.1 hypothetical protein BDZ99DRAFT_570508 [Mytilinidion resinicola]